VENASRPTASRRGSGDFYTRDDTLSLWNNKRKPGCRRSLRAEVDHYVRSYGGKSRNERGEIAVYDDRFPKILVSVLDSYRIRKNASNVR
jgi:hypothetical protein